MELCFERFVSLTERHTAAMKITLKADRDCKLRVDSRLDGQVKATGYRDGEFGCFIMDEFNVGKPNQTDGVTSVTNTIKRAGFTVSTAQVDNMDGVEPKAALDGDFCACNLYDIDAKAGKAYTLTKVICYTTDRDDQEPEAFVRKLAKDQFAKGYDALRAEQYSAWEAFWEDVGVEFTGDTAHSPGCPLRHVPSESGRRTGRHHQHLRQLSDRMQLFGLDLLGYRDLHGPHVPIHRT